MPKINSGVFVLIGKLGSKIFPLITKIAKSGKVVKVGLAGASVATYSYLLTWQFAILLMFSIFIHELGHVRAMRRKGIETKGIYFLPGLGAAAVGKMERDMPYQTEACIAIWGPVYGLILAIITAVAYFITGLPVLAAAASWMCLVNLFNLLPINPLDGGRILKSLMFSISDTIGTIGFFIGIIILAMAMKFFGLGLFLLLLIIGTLEFVGDVYISNKDRKKRYKAILEYRAARRMRKTECFLKYGSEAGYKIYALIHKYNKKPSRYFFVPKRRKRLTVEERWGYALSYLLLSLALFIIMMLMTTPESKLAMEMLKG